MSIVYTGVSVDRESNELMLYCEHMNDDQNSYWQPDPETESPDQQVVEPSNDEPHPAEPAAQPVAPEEKPVTWSAQEYVHLEKNNWWYVIFVIAVLGFVALDFFVLQSWTFSILVIVMAIALIIYIRRPPRTLTYALSAKQGLYVGERLYHFDEFKSFGLIRDGEHFSIMMIPRKRFAPGVSVYFPEEAGEQIVDVLGQRLPMEELKLDVIDVIVRKLRL